MGGRLIHEFDLYTSKYGTCRNTQKSVDACVHFVTQAKI